MKTIHSEKYHYLLDLLKEMRDAAGITQNQLSQKLGKPQSYVSKYENGDRRLDVIELLDICKEIRVDPHEILDRLEKN